MFSPKICRDSLRLHSIKKYIHSVANFIQSLFVFRIPFLESLFYRSQSIIGSISLCFHLGDINVEYCYRMIFAGAEVLMVHIRYLTLGLHVAVNACTVVRGLLYNLRCSGYSPVTCYVSFESNGRISQLCELIHLSMFYITPTHQLHQQTLFLSISLKKERRRILRVKGTHT